MTATSSSARPARRRFYVPAPNAFQPIATINTTPLIDLMLVLLIMFIISIPAATHKVPVDLPLPSPDQLQPVPVHRLGIDEAGGLSWDGSVLPDSQLPLRLRALAADPASPDLHLAAVAEARYERVDQVLAQVKRAGIRRLGFIGHQDFVTQLDSE